MEAAQTALEEELRAHGVNVPQVLLPDATNDWSVFPPHVIGAPEAASSPIPPE